MEPEKKKRCSSVVKIEEISTRDGKEGELELGLGTPAAARAAESREVEEFYSILRRMHMAASYLNLCSKEKKEGGSRGGIDKSWLQPSLVMEGRSSAAEDVVAPVDCGGNDLKRKRRQDWRRVDGEEDDSAGAGEGGISYRRRLDLNADPDA